DTGTLDFEAQRSRAPRRARLAADRPLTVVWAESSAGLPSRFVLAEVDWSTSAPQASGYWTALMPAGEQRVVFPGLPAELAQYLPPTQAAGGRFIGSVRLFDDTGFESYADVLVADLSGELGDYPLPRSSDVVSRSAVIGFSGVHPDSTSTPLFSVVSDPPASGGRTSVVAGQTLRVTAEVDGVPYPDVTWSVSPSTSQPIIDGPTITVRADVPGQVLVVSATSVDRSVVNELLVDVSPPDCLKTWPPLRPTRFGAQLPNFLHIAVAVRRDGSPVVATAMMGSQLSPETTIEVVTWDGVDWSDLGEPIAVSWPFLPAETSPLALALDGQDRPILEYLGNDGIEVR